MISVHVCVRFHCFKNYISFYCHFIIYCIPYVLSERRGGDLVQQEDEAHASCGLYMAQPTTAYVPVSVCTLCIFAGVILVLEVFMCMQSYSNDII
jgi:hypothetical protein